jgi:hypothetical protein
MKKYNVEENIDFYSELFKSLDEPNDDNIQTKLCQITSMPLTDKHVILECNHAFNYVPLYKEICNQKLRFKTYEFKKLNKKDQNKVNASGLEYYIKCPYCRNIQFTVLPYYEELELNKIYGINSIDKSIAKQCNRLIYDYDDGYIYILYGKKFKYGKCCSQHHDSSVGFLGGYVANIPNTDKVYCIYHYKDEEKKQNKFEKQQILDKMNENREAKGFKPLKQLNAKNQTQNQLVQSTEIIEPYIQENKIMCNAILKTGINKGKYCGAKIYNDGVCKRHYK